MSIIYTWKYKSCILLCACLSESLLTFITEAVFFLMQGFNYLQAQAYAIQNYSAFSLNLENSFLNITNKIMLIHKLIY